MPKPPVAKDSDLMFFGKHKGIPIGQVPADYLDWVVDQDWFLQYVALYNYVMDNENKFSEKVDETQQSKLDDESTPW